MIYFPAVFRELFAPLVLVLSLVPVLTGVLELYLQSGVFKVRIFKCSTPPYS